MAKTPTNATKTTPPKVGAAAPKAAAPATPKAADDAAGTAAAAGAAGSAAPLTAPAQDGTAQTAGLTPPAHENGPALTDEQIQAIKDAAYKEGYSNGFSAALDEQSDEQAKRDPDLEGIQDGTAQYADNGTSYFDRDRADLISLALFTPENQRKGGLFVVVNRLQQFVDSLPVEDRYAALQFMGVIARTNPMDLASGRFKNVTVEAIEALKGEGIATLTGEESANASEAAMSRMQAAAPDLDNKPETLIDEEGEALPDGVDIMDPDSSAAAAARLAGV